MTVETTIQQMFNVYQAEENIKSFADDYRFCTGCGAKMEDGEYVK